MTASGLDGKRVRVRIPIAGPRYESETVWAIDRGGGRYEIDNIPVLAYGLNRRDVIRVHERSGQLEFESVASRSGHRTFRVLARPAADPAAVRDLLAILEVIGVAVQPATPRLFVLDVDPSLSTEAVIEPLERGWSVGLWQYENAASPPESTA